MLRCLVLNSPHSTRAIDDLRRYGPYIDAVEIIVDLNDPPAFDRVKALCGDAPPTVILSCSPGIGKEDSRQSLCEKVLLKLLQPGVTHVDIEEGLECPDLEKRARESGIRIIRSIHDDEGVPEDLVARMRGIVDIGALPRLTCRPRTSAEVLGLMEMTRQMEDMEKIVVGVGLFAFFGRIAPWLFGSTMTCLSVKADEIESGEIDPVSLETVYRFSQRGEDSQIYGIIGNPVVHTRSPHLHNNWFESEGLNAIYLPFHVDEVGPFMEIAKMIGLKGLSVTVPHKHEIIRYLDRVGHDVSLIGSCNTVIYTGEGWGGSNTDYKGFLEPLGRLFPSRQFNTALVVGAGGAARAVVYALLQEGIHVVIVNRTATKAESLARDMGVSWIEMEDIENLEKGKDRLEFELVVQTTSAGMSPDIETDPLPGYRFSGREVVYDIIYAPVKTKFLNRAAEAGAAILGGREMLEAQAVLQFRLFRSVYSRSAG